FSCFFRGLSPTVFYTLSLHDALPIFGVDDLTFRLTLNHFFELAVIGILVTRRVEGLGQLLDERDRHVDLVLGRPGQGHFEPLRLDRKSTRLNSSHLVISYAVFCLKKK